VIAGPREERLNVLAELVRLGAFEREATDRGDHKAVSEAKTRMREVVSLLGFDPLEYEPGRDAAAKVINRRVQRMLDAMPATTSQLAKAAGVTTRDVPAYLCALINHGDVVCERVKNSTHWKVTA
jgi:hypothetical protein